MLERDASCIGETFCRDRYSVDACCGLLSSSCSGTTSFCGRKESKDLDRCGEMIKTSFEWWNV